VRRYQQPIAAYLWRFTRDRRQWEELVHDVFVEAYLGLRTYAGRAPLLHWLKRIATRVGYRHWQVRQCRQQELPLPDEAEHPPVAEERESARHAGELVHQLLAALAPRDRLVLTLAYLEECSVAEVAQLTGWTRTMVKVQLHRARKRLAQICRQRGVEL
jgi:RNA polymerase sigma-70 factor, ECF subfamily